MEVMEGHIYDFPKYYDLVYGSDWKAEFDFLTGCFKKYSKKPVKSLFEPACGTGRLLIKFAQEGYEVAGNDLNPKAIKFCNDRLKRHGYPESTFVGDMSDFKVKKKYDAAFNMINSFRHLPNEKAAEAHFHCMAETLKKGGIYYLGLHLTPTKGQSTDHEEWPARRGNLTVISSLWSDGIDFKTREEKIGMSYQVYTPLKAFRIVDDMIYRTYTAEQFLKLIKKTDCFEIEETYDFCYELDHPIKIDAETEDTVFVLRRK
ncbi:MAG: class I SAM-dependent methyltransferase [Planctomycetaceae bacterium]